MGTFNYYYFPGSCVNKQYDDLYFHLSQISLAHWLMKLCGKPIIKYFAILQNKLQLV